MSVIEDYFFQADVPDISGSFSTSLVNAKMKMGITFYQRAKKTHKNVAWSDLAKIYDNWKNESESSLANKISKELEQIMKNELQQQITGAGFNPQAIIQKLNPEADYEEIKISSKYSALVQELQLRIDTMLTLLEDTNGDLQKAALEACIGRQISDPELAARYDGKILSLGLDDSSAETFQSLKDCYEAISSLANEGTQSVLKNATPETFAKKIAGSLNAIAGESVFEVLVVHIANQLLKEAKNIDKTIMDTFISKTGQKIITNGNFLNISVSGQARQSSDVHQKGSQGKPDFYITWDDGKITLTLGGSVKFRQSKYDFSKNGNFKGSIRYDISFNEILNRAMVVNANSRKAFEGSLAAILQEKHSPYGGGYSDATTFASTWDTMKNNILYEAILDKFVGDATSNSFGDINFADFIVVNQYIQPFWDVIQNIINTPNTLFGEYITMSGSYNWKFNNQNFTYWKAKTNYSYKTKTELQWEQHMHQETMYNLMLDQILNKKIYMNLNIGNMLFSR